MRMEDEDARDGVDLTRNNNKEKKLQILQASRCALCDKYFRRD